MTWTVRLERRAVRDLERLDKTNQTRIKRFLRERLANRDDPRELGEALTGEFKGLWKYRVGDYRLIATFEDRTITISIITIGHRRKVYR